MTYPITDEVREKINNDMFHEHRLGYWLPKDRSILVAWTKQLMERIRKIDPPPTLDPVLVDFQIFVSTHPVLGPLSNSMFSEVPNVAPYNEDPEGNQEVKDFNAMLVAFNALLGIGPTWNDIANCIGLIGCPFNAIVDWPMATASGYMFFLWPEVNQHLQKILAKWEEFLKTGPSAQVLLPPLGWFGDHGLAAVVAKANQNGMQIATTLTFPEIFGCPDPTNADQKYGFACWEDFFVRKFNAGIRPLPTPEDDSVILHACESAPLQYPVSPVQLTDNFQGKNQLYSLNDMYVDLTLRTLHHDCVFLTKAPSEYDLTHPEACLIRNTQIVLILEASGSDTVANLCTATFRLDQDPLAAQFAGGTVYQAFLSCLSYHQWHAPVSGTIVSQRVVPGTYYSQNLYQTFFGHDGTGVGPNVDTPDPAGPTWSQPYIASVAVRGLIFIQADNPDIGLFCFMAIGMSDTSAVEFDFLPKHHFAKGDVMGRFHFGGSTYCLIFGPQVKLMWDGIPPQGDATYWPTSLDAKVDNMPDFPVNSMLARVVSSK